MKVVIIGGGIVGASTAYFLTRHQGRCEVTLVERHAVAGCASGKAGGFLARDWCSTSAQGELARTGFALHASLAETLGPERIDYRRLDTIQTDIGSKRRIKGEKKSIDLPHWFDGTFVECSQIGSPSTTAQVHPEKLTRALMEEAAAAGCQLLIHEGSWGKILWQAIGIHVVDSQVTGVQLRDGTMLEADAVVVCMGPWSKVACSWFPGLPQVNALKAHSIVTRPSIPFTPHAIFMTFLDERFDSDPEIYPRQHGLVYACGITESPALPDDPAQVLPTPGACTTLRQTVARVASSLKDAEVLIEQACFLPLSPDDVPMIGAIPNVQGAFIGAGHGCWGILNGPVTGQMLSQLILDGACTVVDAKPFSPSRFF